MPKVSIITPVYNAEHTLERTLESIINQTWNDYELVLIDDGSTDNSLAICKKYANKDRRIKVIAQGNQGPSSARNCGLKIMTGEYLMCVDADDVLHVDAIEKLIKKMERTGADVCIFSWNEINGGEIKPYVFHYSEMVNEKEKLCVQILKGNYRSGGGNPWNKIWRLKAFSGDNSLALFDESIRIYEDMLWTLQNLYRVKKIVFEEEQLYDYYILDSSISRKGNSLERRKEFYYGAKRVYEYVYKHNRTLETEAKLWFRNRMRKYVKIKQEMKQDLTTEERIDLKKFPILPMRGDKPKEWLAFLIQRVYWEIKK